MKMVLAGLKEGYPWNSQEYPFLKPASAISTDILRNILGDIPPLARALSYDEIFQSLIKNSENDWKFWTWLKILSIIKNSNLDQIF